MRKNLRGFVHLVQKRVSPNTDRTVQIAKVQKYLEILTSHKQEYYDKSMRTIILPQNVFLRELNNSGSIYVNYTRSHVVAHIH